MDIKLRQVSKKFKHTEVLAPLDLTVTDGEMLALLGPSGSGKTTLLRIIAGLESCTSGSIMFGAKDVSKLHLRKRKVGFVFQHYALFAHLNVLENIAFGLSVLPRKIRPSKQQRLAKAAKLLQMVRLEKLAKRYPSQLSGGQKQRIALARALAIKPDVLLLDEPFGALDAQVRKDLRIWLRSLHDELGFTSVFVTHDQEEAFELADTVAVLHAGKIQQVNSPIKLYEQPANQFVFEFLGHVNQFNGKLDASSKLWQQNGENTAYLELPRQLQATTGSLYLRSHEVSLSKKPQQNNNLKLKVTAITPVGQEVRLSLQPLNFSSNKPWEISLSHAEQYSLNATRGEVFYLEPRIGHIFTAENAAPATLKWQSNAQKIMQFASM